MARRSWQVEGQRVTRRRSDPPPGRDPGEPSGPVCPGIAFRRSAPPDSRALKRWSTRALFFSAVIAASWLRGANNLESFGGTLAAQVVIVANSREPSSLRVAQHYAAARLVPKENIIALPMPTDETITWDQFVPLIWEPLMTRLVQDRWIDAIPMNLTDSVGRRKYAVNRHRIAALVVCRGVPLRIAQDDQRSAPALPFTSRAEFRSNACAVDAELGLLPAPNHPINAFVLNPLFQNEHPTELEEQQVVKVSRLDGPTAEDAMALVDRAITAEREGLLGRAYVDLSERDALGNSWLESTAAQLRALGFDTDVDHDPAVLPLDARIDAPVLYFGWYSQDVSGVFTLPGLRFPPGAIALHIHSYSATTLHSRTIGWAGPLVALGVTATVGNVYEPYLQLTHRPNLLLRSLARGATFVDAGYFALQALSWQEVLIGDPLYRPFAVPLARQLDPGARTPPDYSPYAILRRANLLDASGRHAEATALLQQSQRERPSLPVALTLARRLRDSGDPLVAAGLLQGFVDAPGFRPDEWALARDAAVFLTESGHAGMAVKVWRKLLAAVTGPEELRRKWLRQGALIARAAHENEQADAWDQEANPPPPPPGPS